MSVRTKKKIQENAPLLLSLVTMVKNIACQKSNGGVSIRWMSTSLPFYLSDHANNDHWWCFLHDDVLFNDIVFQNLARHTILGNWCSNAILHQQAVCNQR